MSSLTGFNRRFTPDWRMTILAVLAIFFFARLGFWQLERAAEKKQMLIAHDRLANQAPLLWKSKEKKPKLYQHITVEGRYLPDILLLDNQHFQHQLGYQVLNPLLISNDEVVLIDRGWVAGDINRQILPKIVMPIGTAQRTGSVYYPSKKNWVLGQAYERKPGHVTIIERIDTQLIGQFLHKSVYPFIIRLDANENDGYVRQWAVVAMPPERHYAYALQWFAIASVVLILFIALNLKKLNEND